MGPTQLSIQWTPAFYPGGRTTGRDVDHSTSSSAKVNKAWCHTSAPSVCFHGLDKDIFTMRHSSQDNNLDALHGKSNISIRHTWQRRHCFMLGSNESTQNFGWNREDPRLNQLLCDKSYSVRNFEPGLKPTTYLFDTGQHP